MQMKNKIKNCMKQFLATIALSAAFTLFSLAVVAQTVVTGKVTESKNARPLPGVTVTVKGTRTSTQTTSDGTYKISLPANAAVLVFSSVGYASQEVTVNGQTADVAMVESSQQLTDVVVVAYGTRKKSDLTGSVVAVGTKDFQKGNINSTEQLLVGKVAGLEVTTGGGSAGGGSKIRIRGGASLNASNDPLIVVDGVPVEGNSVSGSANVLNTINPDDIESISVLKDASATALYGSRASNGVMIITTKKGRSGKFVFNFNTKFSVSNPYKKVKVLSADEITQIVTDNASATGLETWKNLLGTSKTDWQDQIFKNALGSDNNLSASGTIKTKNFVLPIRASLGYLKQDGILKTNTFDRISSSLNLSPKFLNDHLTVNINAKYAYTKNRFADEGAIGSAINFDPTQSIYDSTNSKWANYFQWLNGDGNPINTNGGSVAPNTVSMLNLRHNTSDVNRLIGNIQLDYKLHFFPDLHILINAGMDNIHGNGNDITDSIAATSWNTKGRVTTYKQNKKNQLLDLQAFYAKELGRNSKIDVLIGHSYQTFRTDVFNYASYGQDQKVIAESVPRFDTDFPEYRLESYMGRMNLSLVNNYLLTASIRRDASSKFSKDNRVGYFPAFAFAWKLKEQFFKNAAKMNELKLRIGWGITGQQDGIDYYYWQPRYVISQNAAALYQLGDTYYETYRAANFNKDLKWETTTTSNIGLDFGFINNRITGSVDVYKKKTKDLLSSVPTPPGSSYGLNQLKNVGNVENKGVEVSINTTPVRKSGLTWDLGFNVTYNESKITNLQESPEANFPGINVSGISGGTGNYIGKFQIGYSPFAFFPKKQVYDQNGKPIEGLYEDLNRDGVVDDKDRYYYKKPAPDFIIGFNTAVTIKKFTVGIAGHGSFGNYLYNNFNSNNSVLRNIQDPLYVVRNAGIDYRNTQFSNQQYLSDYYIENASFVRIDNVNLGYNFGAIYGGKASLRLNASVQNVYTFTKYSGLDPESANSSGVDYTIYPRPRIFTVGASIDF
jgi:TonB-dependent starch-binding outer membrane protein SusC